MNSNFRNILLVLVIFVLAGALFFAGTWYARANAFGPFQMMGGNGYYQNNNFFPGMGNHGNMMNGYGPGGMMRGTGPMMGGYGYNNAKLTPLTVDQAKTAAENYLAKLNDSDLKISEIMIFDNNAYIVVQEASTGKGAFELLVNSSSQIAYPEHGPNMMWNLKYNGLNHQYMMGGLGGMMGNFGWSATTPIDISVEMAVTSEQAIEAAQKYLDNNIANATAAKDPVEFYGYYTLDYEVNGNVAGMLSVNGYTGQVFLHTWHGTFIEESEVE